MEFPELPSVKQKSPTHPFGLKSRKSANLFKRTLSHDQGIKQLRVESTSGSALSLSPSWLPPPSEPACWDENKATSSASCNVQLSTGHSWPSTSDSAVVGTGKWAFTNGLENYRRCGTELATGTRRRCNSIPPDNKLKITAVQQATGSTVSSSPNEKKKKKKEEGKVEPQIYKPMKTCEGASVTTPPSTEKTDIGYLFICKEDKLTRIPIKLDVDRKEERYMQNASLGAYYSSFQKYAVICGYRGLFKVSCKCKRCTD
uniref:Uncharacterized protein n=1 Tax=Schistocephalus solidus TaxID=70667 RepID=A0A0X3NYP1_SCHSO